MTVASVDRGRRALVYLSDVAIALVMVLLIDLLPILLVLGGLRSVAAVNAIGVITLLFALVYAAATLWALVGRSARLSGLFLGVAYVDVDTGRPAPGKLLLKYLLQALVGVVSLGIAPPIVSWVSCTGQEQRTWFDRKTNLVAVDTRAARQAVPSAPVALSDPRPSAGAVENVVLPAVAPPPTATPSTAPTVTPPSWALPPAAPPVAPVDAALLGPIDVTPLTGQRPMGARPEPSAPVAMPPRPEVVIRDARPVEAGAAPDHTELLVDPALAPGRPGVPRVTLAGVGELALDTPCVLGRNPVPPASHPDARKVAVVDPAMSISKTHLVIGADADGVWVVDLFSTNGVAVAGADGVRERVEAGVRRAVPAGGRVYFGGLRLEVSS